MFLKRCQFENTREPQVSLKFFLTRFLVDYMLKGRNKVVLNFLFKEAKRLTGRQCNERKRRKPYCHLFVAEIDLLPWFVTFITGLCLGIEVGVSAVIYP